MTNAAAAGPGPAAADASPAAPASPGPAAGTGQVADDLRRRLESKYFSSSPSVELPQAVRQMVLRRYEKRLGGSQTTGSATGQTELGPTAASANSACDSAATRTASAAAAAANAAAANANAAAAAANANANAANAVAAVADATDPPPPGFVAFDMFGRRPRSGTAIALRFDDVGWARGVVTAATGQGPTLRLAIAFEDGTEEVCGPAARPCAAALCAARQLECVACPLRTRRLPHSTRTCCSTLLYYSSCSVFRRSALLSRASQNRLAFRPWLRVQLTRRSSTACAGGRGPANRWCVLASLHHSRKPKWPLCVR